MPENEFDDFTELAKKDKAGRRLHSLVEKQLTLFLTRLYPNDCTVAEVSGVLGGRNDLMQFAFNGRRIVFELFFSPGQVPQDLRLLEQAKADIKIAIVLDREVNPKLADEFFHKKPDHFPFLWLSFLMMPSREKLCLAQLRELIDEDASINRLRRILSSSAGSLMEESLRRKLEEIEAFLGKGTSENSNQLKLTVGQSIVLQIISRIRKMGIPIERLRTLYAWLQDGINFAYTLVTSGFQAFLITDLNSQFAIWSDCDLADDLILSAEDNEEAYLVICLNKIINDHLVDNGFEKLPIRWHFRHTYEEFRGIIAPDRDTEEANMKSEIETHSH
jgi:hypothetical protein